VLPDGALTIETEADRPTVSALKGIRLNLVALLNELLYLLQDGVITELQTREQRTLQIIIEKKVNNTQMALQ